MSHVNLGKLSPAAYRSLSALSDTAEQEAIEAGLEPVLVELVKIRASQLNGCAFCLRMHSRDAIAQGETADRLAVVAAWWESQYFSEREQAALILSEQITNISLTSGAFHPTVDVHEVLSPQEIAAVSWIAVVINSWNRVAISSHYSVAP